VLVLEPATAAGAAWRAAAGMLAAQIGAFPEDPMFQLGIAGRERYVDLAPALEETTGIDIQLWRGGIARIATDELEVTALRTRVAWQQQLGHRADWCEPDEVRARWPWLGTSHGAFWAPNEAALDPALLVTALLNDARLAGAEIRNEEVQSLLRKGDRVTGVVARERYSAEHVVVAAGAWSPGIGGSPRPLPIVPVRGQMVAFPWPRGIERAIIYGKDVYLVSRGHEAIAGSTMEHAGFSPEVTPAGLGHIYGGISALFPSLSSDEVTRTWAGLRPVTPDGQPILGRESRVAGLWYATGHGRNGILLAGITGVLLTQLLNGESPNEDITAFRPERFYEWHEPDIQGW
jgi:glycine oxidase